MAIARRLGIDEASDPRLAELLRDVQPEKVLDRLSDEEEDESTSGIAEHTRMRAAVLTGPGRFTIEGVARPAPGPGEVRIRIEGCGVCASNLTPWAGPDWMRFPTVPGDLGHEGWGVVDRVGEGVTNVSPEIAWPHCRIGLMRNTIWLDPTLS